MLLKETHSVKKLSMGINYGCNKVRFINPVKTGSRVRGVTEVIAAEEVGGGAIQFTVQATVEIEGEDKPACVAETISRFYP